MCRNYGILTSLALDPIEKKPLARFHPGSTILSLGSFGCNMDCPFCQNWEISRMCAPSGSPEPVTPERIVSLALSLVPRGNIGAAFTYNEPLIGWEFVRDVSRALHGAGLLSVAVTNGMLCKPYRAELLPLLDACNVDLKCFTAEGYRALGGELETAQDFIREAREQGVHVEVTTLVVPGLSDGTADMAREAAWLAEVDPAIPLHVTRYFPRHRMDSPATDLGLLRTLAAAASERLETVLVGNV